MPQVPTHIFTPTRTGPTAVLGNTGMFNAEAAAANRIGQAVQAGAEQLAQFALKKAEAKNFADVMTAERKMKEGFILFQDEMAKEGDETKWGDAWTKRQGAIVKEIGVDKLAPAARDRLEPMLQDWSMETSQRVNHASSMRQIERSKVKVQQSAEADLKFGNIAAYESKIREGEANGLFGPAEAAGLITDGERRADVYAATNMILNDPVGAHESLMDKTEGGRWRNYKELSEPDRKQLVDSANVAVQRARTETYQGLIDRMNSGEVIGDAELNTLVDSKMLNATQAKTVRDNQQRSKITEGASQAFAETLSAINGYDPSNDPDNSGYADLMVAVLGLPPGMKEDATSRLKEKGDKGSPLNSASAKEAFGYVEQAFKFGFYGDYATRYMNDDGAWVTKIDKATYSKALAKKVKVEDALTEFILKNPDSTRAEKEAFVAEQNAEDIVKAGAMIFSEPDDFDPDEFNADPVN